MTAMVLFEKSWAEVLELNGPKMSFFKFNEKLINGTLLAFFIKLLQYKGSNFS